MRVDFNSGLLFRCMLVVLVFSLAVGLLATVLIGYGAPKNMVMATVGVASMLCGYNSARFVTWVERRFGSGKERKDS